MNGVLNTGLEFWQFIVAVLVALIGIVAVRITFSIDINKLLENRQKLNISKLRNTCTHLQLIPSEDGDIQVQSFFVSPSGTSQWRCERCGIVTDQIEDEIRREANYYLNNIDQYTKMNKRFSKLLKKSGLA